MSSRSDVTEATNPIADFVQRVAARGYKGLRLYVRAGAALELVDEYSLEAGVAELVWQDAQRNAEGFADVSSSYVLRAAGDGTANEPTRSFSVIRPPSPHSVERFDPGDKAMVRLLLEQNHKSHRVITEVLPALMVSLTNVVNGLVEPIREIAQTQGEAIREIRDGRAAAAREERETLRQAAQDARMDQLFQMGVAFAPEVIKRLLPENPPPPAGGGDGGAGS